MYAIRSYYARDEPELDAWRARLLDSCLTRSTRLEDHGEAEKAFEIEGYITEVKVGEA